MVSIIEAKKSKKFWAVFILVIISLRFSTNLIQIYFSSSSPNLFIDLFYSFLNIGVIVIFLYYFKRQDIIINSFIPKSKKEIAIIIGSIAFIFFIFVAFGYPLNIQIFFNKYFINQVFVVSSEETLFRILLLSILLSDLNLINLQNQVYLKNFIKWSLQIVIGLTISSILFAFWHVVNFDNAFWQSTVFLNHLKRGFLYGIFYILTNKKIYPSLLFHYYNNMLAFRNFGLI